jgi:uncharacterized protein YdaU (DUF1376 family)
MHYYKRNLGDYAKKAGKLSMLQHGAYTVLIDACYDREQFPTMEEAIDWAWASTAQEVEAVEFVLRKFFKLVNGRYMQDRIQEEIETYQRNCETNSRIAIEREEKRKASSPMRAQTVHEAPPNQEPLTINQEQDIKPFVPSDAGDLLPSAIVKPDCPHQSIIALYHERLPQCPAIRDWTPARATQLRARWNESAERQNLDYWARLFEYIGTCDFLVGRSAKPWFADLEWITKSQNFTKIREGKYENRA